MEFQGKNKPEKIYPMLGRPPKSKIRDNIVNILHSVKEGEGYFLYKIYRDIFGNATMRSIYYHLKKGCELGIFRVKEIKNEQGRHSWGESAKKIIYELGDKAIPKPNTRLNERIKKRASEIKRLSKFYNDKLRSHTK